MTAPEEKGVTAPEEKGVTAPEASGVTALEASSVAAPDASGVAAPEANAREDAAAGLLGLVMVVAAVVVLVDAATLRDSEAALGPAAVPTLLGVLLGVLGAALAIRSRRSLRTVRIKVPTRLAAMVAALLAFAFLLPILGYVVCSAALFTAAALLLGAPHPGRAGATGWTLAVLVFVLFDHVIGLSLPTGPWGF